MADPDAASTDHGAQRSRGTDHGEQTPAASDSTDSGGRGRRDVVVPLRLYKTITVFSTLIAAASILAGFILLDAATLQVSVLRGLLVLAIEAVWTTPDQGLLSGLLGVAGLCLMALGSGVFVLSSRFRTAGMGNSQDDADEESINGR
jgi:hypothetical protein